MRRNADKAQRRRARERFQARFEATGDYRQAAKAAGITARTGRRWRAELAELSELSSPWSRVASAAPGPPTSFVGRAKDVAEVLALLRGPARLVSVCGPPGIGKSRMLGRIVAETKAAVFVDLTAVRTRDDIVSCVAATLGLSLVPAGLTGLSCVAQISRFLVRRQTRLVALDNFEQVGSHAPQTVDLWLRDVPELRIVVGTRHRLRLPAEHVFELGPLEFPADERDARDPWGLDAGRLLLARIQQRRPKIARPTDPQWIRHILRRLEGNPLAIELAAALVETVGARRVLEIVDHSSLLDAEVDGVRSLESAIESSWRLLPAAEQELLACLSLFRGEFDHRAAAEVFVVPGGDAARVSNLLAGLLSKSLLRRYEGRTGPLRFGLYEAVREFAARRLAQRSWADDAKDRFVRHFIRRARSAAEGLDGPADAEASRFFVDHLGNLMAAIAIGTQRGDTTAVAELSLCLHPILLQRGPGDLHRDLLHRAGACTEPLSSVTRHELLIARSEAELAAGSVDAATRCIRAASTMRLHCDNSARSRVLEVRGRIEFARGRIQEAAQNHRRALRGLPRRPTLLRGRLEFQLGDSLAELGEHADAEVQLHRACAVFRSLGARRRLGEALRSLGHSRLQVGAADALATLTAAGRLADALGLELLRGQVQLSLGALHHDVGRLDAAAHHYQVAEQLFESLGALRNLGTVRMMRALVAFERGRTLAAHERLDRAEAALGQVGDARYTAVARAYRCLFEAAPGRYAALCEALDDAQEHVRRSGDVANVALIEMVRVHVERFEAQGAAAEGDDARARALADRARARWRRIEGSGSVGSSEDTRIVARLMAPELALDPAEPRRGPRIDVEGAWIDAGDGPHELAPSSPARRVLRRLLEQHSAAPGRPVSHDGLILAGWGDEKMSPSSSRARLKFTVHRLRSLGLRGVIQTRRAGYLIDPGSRVHVVRDSELTGI